MRGSDAPASELITEGLRILEAAAHRQIPVRLLGGVAVHLHLSGPLPEAIERPIDDIDLVTLPKQGSAVTELMVSLDYEPHRVFNTMNSGRRALFHHASRGHKVDLFIGSFEMCHATSPG